MMKENWHELKWLGRCLFNSFENPQDHHLICINNIKEQFPAPSLRATCSPCHPPLLLKLQEIQSLKLDKVGCFPQHVTGPDIQEPAKGWGPWFWTSGLGSGKSHRIPPGQNKNPRQSPSLKCSRKFKQNTLDMNIWMKREEDLRRPELENTDNSVFPSGNFLKSPTTFSPYLKYPHYLCFVMLDMHQWGQNRAESETVHLSF